MPIRKFAGLETEYSLHISVPGHPMSAGVPDSKSERLVRQLVHLAGRIGRGWTSSTDRNEWWLANGGLLYIDIGNHPEYATPETANPFELIRQHKAGNHLMALAIAHANAADSNVVRRLFANNVDSAGNTFGTHESYCIDAALHLPDVAGVLGSFLASRIVMTGAGTIATTNGITRFEVSARAQHITQLLSASTTDNRPLINVRDEALADRERFRRLHLICGDANRCDVANLLKIGTTAIVLGMLEDNVPLSDLAFANPVHALHHTSQHPHAWSPLPLAEGYAIDALEHQREFAARARTYVASSGRKLFSNPNMARRIVDRWQHTLDLLSTNAEATIGLLDWTTKAHLIEHAARRRGCAINDPMMVQYDLRWGEVSGKNYVSALEAKGNIEVLVPGLHDDLSDLTPPKDSRAALRGLLVRAVPEKIVAMSWDATALAVSSGPGAEQLAIHMNDPSAFSATALQAAGITSESITLPLALAVLRRRGFALAPDIPMDQARAFLAIAHDAPSETRRFIGNAVARAGVAALSEIGRTAPSLYRTQELRDWLDVLQDGAMLSGQAKHFAQRLDKVVSGMGLQRASQVASARERYTLRRDLDHTTFVLHNLHHGVSSQLSPTQPNRVLER